MRSRICLTAAAIAMIAGMSLAVAAERDTSSGVTILRGGGTMQNTGSDARTTGPIGTNDSTGGRYIIDNSGGLNSTFTGSSGAGGVITNPPPGAGR